MRRVSDSCQLSVVGCQLVGADSVRPVGVTLAVTRPVETQYNASKSGVTLAVTRPVETQYNASKLKDAIYSVSTTLLLLFLLLSSTLFASANPLIDIFITESSQITISTEDRFNSINSKNLSIRLNNGNIQINNKNYGKSTTLKSRKPIIINDIPYTGEMKLSVINNKIRIINSIHLEDYVAGVIAAEIGGSSPLEALKAQAIATRTYTVTQLTSTRHKADGYDLCNTTHCQVYSGLKGQTPQSIKATKETAHRILVYNDKPIGAFYSSSCGGITESSGNIWSINHDYLQPHLDNYCINKNLTPTWTHRNLNWQKSYTLNELEKLLSINNITDISVTKYNSSARVTEITVKTPSRTHTISGSYDVRGKFNLLSTLYWIKKEGNKVTFIGNGYGHGVGMCQTGAIARANSGHNATEILKFYYPGASIDSRWLSRNELRIKS